MTVRSLAASRRIGVLVVAIAVAFAGGVLALAFPRNTAGQITVTARFPKTIGLFPQSHVRVLGVSVGRVTAVRPDGEDVRVMMRIDADRKIPADARAVIVPISLIADRYVQLAPAYTSGPVLEDGDVIPISRTAIPAELDDLLAQLKKFLDAVEVGTPKDPASLGEAITNLAAALAGTGEDFSKALSGGAELAGSVLENTQELDAIIGHLSGLMAALADRRSDIALLNTRLAQALGAVASERGALESALSNVATMTEQLGSLVSDHRQTLETDLAILAKTTHAVVGHQDSLLRSLDWLHVLADGVERSHEGGAVHGDPPHIDVRDAHLYTCPPTLPAAVCLLLGLQGEGLPSIEPGADGRPPDATGDATSSAAEPGPAPLGPDPADLLDLLPDLPLDLGTSRSMSSPSLRGFFDRLGGFVDRAMGWLL